MRVEGLQSVVDLISQLAAAVKTALEVPASSAFSTHARDPALVIVCSTQDELARDMKTTMNDLFYRYAVVLYTCEELQQSCKKSSMSSLNSPWQWVPSFGMKTVRLLDGLKPAKQVQ